MTSEENEANEATATDENDSENSDKGSLGTTYGWVKEDLVLHRRLINEAGEVEERNPRLQSTYNKSWEVNGVTVFIGEVTQIQGRPQPDIYAAQVTTTATLGSPVIHATAIWADPETGMDFCESMTQSWLDEFPDLYGRFDQLDIHDDELAERTEEELRQWGKARLERVISMLPDAEEEDLPADAGDSAGEEE